MAFQGSAQRVLFDFDSGGAHANERAEGADQDLMRMEWSPSGRNPSNGQTRLILLPVSASVSESPLRWGQAYARAEPFEFDLERFGLNS